MEIVDTNEEKNSHTKGGKSRLVKVLLKPAKFAMFEKARESANFGGYGHLSDYFNYLFDSRQEIEKWRWEIIMETAKTIKRFQIQEHELLRAKKELEG